MKKRDEKDVRRYPYRRYILVMNNILASGTIDENISLVSYFSQGLSGEKGQPGDRGNSGITVSIQKGVIKCSKQQKPRSLRGFFGV